MFLFQNIVNALNVAFTVMKKDSCECRCVGLEEWKTEEEIENNCTECEQQYI